MNLPHPTRPIMQAAEREEDFLPRDPELGPPLQSMISTTDPITGKDVGDLEGKPSLVVGNLTMYFESEQTLQAYLNKHQLQA